MGINSKYAEKFWEGYRAFVYGGRKVSFSGRGGKCRVLDSSLKPYANFNEEEKEQWRRGILYAQKERDECRAITFEGNQNTFAINHKKIKSLFLSGAKPSIVAHRFGVTPTTARIWRRKLFAALKNQL